MPRSLKGSTQIYFDRTATSLKFNGHAAYSVDVVWLSFTGTRRVYLGDHGCNLLEFLPAGTAEVEVRDGDLKVDKNFFLYGLSLSDVVPLKKGTP